MAGKTLLASAARTDSGVQALTDDFSAASWALFQLVVTAAATESGDLLDVYLQHSLDGGTTWDDFVHFTQVLGDGGAKKDSASWRRDDTPTSPLHAPQDAAMAAGINQGPVGDQWRIKWVIVDAGGDNASFTFSVIARVTRAK